MTIFDAFIRVASRCQKLNTDSTVKTRIYNYINQECEMGWNDHSWTFRWREYPIQLQKDLTTSLTPTSTATVTTSSTSITFSDNPFPDTTTFVGGWIRFLADSIQNWYRIDNITATNACTINPAYPTGIPGVTNGTTSGKSYEIKKTDYLAPTELTDLGSVSISYFGLPVTITSATGHAFLSQPPLYRGIPQSASFLDTGINPTTYTTGTITTTANSQSVTGSGTAWLANVQPGDQITFNTDTYTIAGSTPSNKYIVYKVLSDTSLVLYQNAQVALAGQTYTITRQYGREVRILPSADNPYTLYIKGLRKYPILINDNDTNDMLSRYPDPVIEGAITRELASSPDQRELADFQKASELWRMAKAADDSLSHKINSVPLHNVRAQGLRIL